MAGWHHRLNAHEFEWSPKVGDGQGGLACCDSWGRKESDTTERLNWTELNIDHEWKSKNAWNCMGSECRVKRKKLTNRPRTEAQEKINGEKEMGKTVWMWRKIRRVQCHRHQAKQKFSEEGRSTVSEVAKLVKGGAASRCPLDLAERKCESPWWEYFWGFVGTKARWQSLQSAAGRWEQRPQQVHMPPG